MGKNASIQSISIPTAKKHPSRALHSSDPPPRRRGVPREPTSRLVRFAALIKPPSLYLSSFKVVPLNCKLSKVQVSMRLFLRNRKKELTKGEALLQNSRRGRAQGRGQREDGYVTGACLVSTRSLGQACFSFIMGPGLDARQTGPGPAAVTAGWRAQFPLELIFCQSESQK